MGDVIQFPNKQSVSDTVDLEEGLEQIRETQIEYVDEFLDTYIPMLFQSAYNNGFDLTESSNTNINNLFVQAFKAALLKTFGIEHHLQKVADDSVQMYLNDNEETINNDDT